MKNLIIYILLLFFCCVDITYAQTSKSFEIKGVVYDDTKETVPGATVYLKDRPGVGTVTDEDGVFSIKASVGDVVTVSFIGYNNYEHIVTGKETNLSITLQVKSAELEDVVVTGLGGSQRKVSLVGAITNVDVQQLQTPATSVNNMLGGRIAGIISRQTSGEPGKNISEFWIRGIGTFGANQSALVLIDGLEGDLSQIDPADIESFSILKDASATAVYGVRGANGVVLVTTKRGTTDKLHITARANFTISHLTRMPKYLRAYDYAKLANEASVVRGNLPLYTNIELDIINNQFDPDLYPDVNWRDEILKNTSLQQTYYINARGGGSLAKYFVSVGMSDESSAYKQEKDNRFGSYNTYNYRANVDMNLTKTTSLYFGIDGWFSKKTSPGNANTNYLWDAQALLTPLTIPVMYSTGHIPAYGANDTYSPYVMLNHTGKYEEEKNNNQITLALNQDLSFIAKGFKARAQAAITQRNEYNERRYVAPAMYYATGRYYTGELMLIKKLDEVTAEFSNWQNQYRKYHFESTVDYSTIIKDDHRLGALLYYYMSDEKNLWDIDNPQNPMSKIKSMASIPKRYQGISGRLTYGLKDTYFVDLNFGYTGSENFQPGKQFGFFPSVAAGWVPSNYDFIKKNLPWLDFLKIRGSYGLVGNDRISDKRFPYLTIMETGAATAWTPNGWGNQYGGGIKEFMVGADNLQWEKAKKMNIGVDGKLFKSKIDFTIDYFVDRRDGIFQQRTQIPDYVGLTSLPYGNVGKMKSWGSDGNISFTQIINKDMHFIIRGNFTYSKNDVENWEQTFSRYPYQDFSGWPYHVQRGYIALGLFKDEADISNSPKQTFGDYLPGDVKYKDVNGDGKIDSDDMVPLAYDNYPRLMYGFGGEFRYKNLTIGVLFKGIGKKDFFYTTPDGDKSGARGLGYYPFLWGETGNVLEIVADQANRWTPASYSGDPSTENPNARFPRLSYGNNDNNTQLSTFWKANGQYLRLQEVSINYNLKLKALSKIGISSVDLQLVGNDLYVWDKIGGLWDPEQTYKNGRSYPIPARYAFQLYLNF